MTTTRDAALPQRVWIAVAGVLTLVAALMVPARADAAAAPTVSISTSTVRTAQGSSGYDVPFDLKLSGVTSGLTADVELTTPGHDVTLATASLKAGQTRWTGRGGDVSRAVVPVGKSWRLTARIIRYVKNSDGSRSGYTLATATRSGTIAKALTPTLTVKADTLVKSSAKCSRDTWTVQAANLDGSGAPLVAGTLTRGKQTIKGTTYPAVNGSQKITFTWCPEEYPAGSWTGSAKLTVTGGPSTTKRATVKVVTTPVLKVTSVSGSRTKSAKRTVYGYAVSGKDVAGKSVRFYYKASGKTTYTYVGSAKIASSGLFKLSTSKVYTGYVYATIAASTYTHSAKSSSFAIHSSALR
ncbi:hypothetical protein [Cellulomonas sp. HZM]|uniref:hypothetical protein n=1 Tax=Cellulomonas sp. HZM TaxID=1454010 RepID=UPI000492F9DD|nr:hypothetical protein [Cellulomonas sp. HZM]